MKDVILVRGEVSTGVFQGCACLERLLGRGWGLCGFSAWFRGCGFRFLWEELGNDQS